MPDWLGLLVGGVSRSFSRFFLSCVKGVATLVKKWKSFLRRFKPLVLYSFALRVHQTVKCWFFNSSYLYLYKLCSMTDVRVLARFLDLVSKFNEPLQRWKGSLWTTLLGFLCACADVLCDPMPLEWVLKSILPRALKQWWKGLQIFLQAAFLPFNINGRIHVQTTFKLLPQKKKSYRTIF